MLAIRRTQEQIKVVSDPTFLSIITITATTTDHGRSPCQGSNFRLLGKFEGVINLDTEVTDRALQLGMSEQDLNRSQIFGPTVDQ